MTVTSRPKLTAIPGVWLEAATLFVDLRDELPLEYDEWNLIVHWLRETKFDARTSLAGEVAAGLIRDHAPMSVKDQILGEDPTDEWQRRFQRAIVSRSRPFDADAITPESPQTKIGDWFPSVIADAPSADVVALGGRAESAIVRLQAARRGITSIITAAREAPESTDRYADYRFLRILYCLSRDWLLNDLYERSPHRRDSSKELSLTYQHAWFFRDTERLEELYAFSRPHADYRADPINPTRELLMPLESSKPEVRELMEAIRELDQRIETLERERAHLMQLLSQC